MSEDNSLASQVSDPCVMVLFGASGDLTKRKLIPALYNLAKGGALSKDFAVIGVARSGMSSEEFRAKMSEDVHKFANSEVDPEVWNWLESRIYYLSGGFSDDALYANLKGMLEAITKDHNIKTNYLYYLATAPNFFGEVVHKLGAAGLATEDGNGWRRVIIEKPFGRDLDSARALNANLREVVKESQIYRIDHYLGKETVQNILVLRFANGIFEPIWNRRYIDHIQITAAEAVNVEGRGGYYDTSGALRDMIPNHLFQTVTLTAMEPPISFEADAVRDEQAKILHAIQPMSPEDVLRRTVRGQYGDGVGPKGERVISYRTEPSVNPTSNTETYVAMKLNIDNWRWADVPFYLRTGKALPKRVTEISIQFKRAPFMLFRDTPVEKLVTNRLVIHVQPDEGISMHFGAKVPGPIVRLGEVDMDFNYVDYFGKTTNTGYERLIYDCMLGDATLFQRADMVEAAWGVVNPIIDVWSALPARNFPNYAAGTWGPKEADELLERDGRRWRKSEKDFSG